MRYWRQFRDSLGETSVMITYIMIDYNDHKAQIMSFFLRQKFITICYLSQKLKTSVQI
jgi:hypothetical protein